MFFLLIIFKPLVLNQPFHTRIFSPFPLLPMAKKSIRGLTDAVGLFIIHALIAVS
jgi:hypothetical protein